MRMDDKTHGDGGDRKGRTENSIRCGFWDKGEVVGQKHASHTSSMVGGSNALGEATPAWFSVASKTVDPAIFRFGPVAQVNGTLIPSHGRCNEKGSVTGHFAALQRQRAHARHAHTRHAHTRHARRGSDRASLCVLMSLSLTGDFAAIMIDESVVPMLNAHGGVSSTRRAVAACDGVTTHMTSQFLDKCKQRHIVISLRTPYCSNSIQFEDLLNFWLLKNAKDVGWYKVKQQAIFERLGQTRGASSTLSHAKQLELVVPCWNVAFSKQSNLTAWEMVHACPDAHSPHTHSLPARTLATHATTLLTSCVDVSRYHREDLAHLASQWHRCGGKSSRTNARR